MAKPLFETRSPAPAKPRVKIDLVGDELVLRWRSGGTCVVLFLIIWIAGWSAGCVMMIRELVTDFEWSMLLFATPFFAAWVAVACVIVGILFGRQELVIARDELRTRWQALVTLSSRTVPIDEVVGAEPDKISTTDSDGDTTIEGVITIETIGRTMQFAKGIADPEAAWIAETINICLDRLAPHRTALASNRAPYDSLANKRQEFEAAKSHDGLSDEASPDILVFEPTRERCEQPCNSHWRLARAGRTVEFTYRGRWSLGQLVGSTFVNLFWNGIVGVFVFELVHDFQWFLALFLIPFELIGLALFLGWLYLITAPLWEVRYSIRFGRVEKLVWGPIYWSKHEWDFDRLDRIEITKSDFSDTTIEIPPKRLSKGEFQITLVDVGDNAVASIDALNQGEALWMADVVMNEQPGMFRRRR